MDTIIKISKDRSELAWNFAKEIADTITEAGNEKKVISIALSGGNTPTLLFSILGDHFAESVPWRYVHLFWGDERCVPPESAESNFGTANKVFLKKINIPPENIHRIRGENNPEPEAIRYSEEIIGNVQTKNNLPVFDLIILGMGTDGHVASIFPGEKELINSIEICRVAIHPVSSQKRITVTGNVINNANNIIFIVTGADKSVMISKIIENPGSVNYPAAYIRPVHGVLKWYLDEDAAGGLNRSH